MDNYHSENDYDRYSEQARQAAPAARPGEDKPADPERSNEIILSHTEQSDGRKDIVGRSCLLSAWNMKEERSVFFRRRKIPTICS